MKKELPYISIEGVGKTNAKKLQSLVEIEPILVMLGYDEPNEIWNNMSAMFGDAIFIVCLYSVGYHNHSGAQNPKQFYASQIDEIIDFVLNHKA